MQTDNEKKNRKNSHTHKVNVTSTLFYFVNANKSVMLVGVQCCRAPSDGSDKSSEI